MFDPVELGLPIFFPILVATAGRAIIVPFRENNFEVPAPSADRETILFVAIKGTLGISSTPGAVTTPRIFNLALMAGPEGVTATQFWGRAATENKSYPIVGRAEEHVPVLDID